MSQNPQKYAMLAYREQQSRQPNHEFLSSRGQDSQIKQRVNLSIAEQLPVVGGEFTVPTTDYRRSQLSGVEQPAVAQANTTAAGAVPRRAFYNTKTFQTGR